MNEYAERLKPFYHFAEKILFPVILILFPLLKVNQGIDLTDTAYSLGNYAFFGENTVLWTLLTFLSNVLGFFFTKLPFGGTMLGMKVYSSLLISAMALLGYRFFRTTMPAVIAFLAELSAIGMCWCPSVILYNYMTYALLLTAVILLFRGLVRKHPGCLVAAGVVLGLNTLVRFPNNGLEVLLILTLWYYGYLKKKPLAEIAKETGLCIAGYAAGFVAVLAGMMLLYGTGTLGTMIEGVFGMAGSASDYTFGEEAALQWGVVFLILSLGICVWMLFSRMQDCEWKLIAAMSLIVVLITPLGSNNYVWPALNNLFFVAPITFWTIYRFARWGRPYLDVTGKVPLFSVKAMTMAMVVAFLIQAVGIGCNYVFLDGEDGHKRDTTVEGSRILRGMKTNAANAGTLEELNTFMLENNTEYRNKKVILYGNIPGLSYYLHKAPAVYTSWADLDTNSYERLAEDLNTLNQTMTEENRPLVIFSEEIMAQVLDLQENGMAGEGSVWEQKLKAILDFMTVNEYQMVFENEKYAVFV